MAFPLMAFCKQQDDGWLSLHFSTKIDFYCLKWTFDCTPITEGERRITFLRSSFLHPLLVITNELQQQVKELKGVIAQKGIYRQHGSHFLLIDYQRNADAEIEEYKAKGTRLPKGE